MRQLFDVAFVGNYAKDIIVSGAGTRLVNGGAFNYGAHVAAHMGLRVAAVTSLKMEVEGPFRRETGEVEELIR